MGLLHTLPWGVFALGVSGKSHAASSSSFEQDCLALAKSLNIPGANSTASEFVKPNTTLTFPDVDASCTRPSQKVTSTMCRVTMQVATSSRSGIKMEVWLPETWTGRFLSTDNGGLGGCIQYEDLDYAASLGFAAVATNNGHDGMTGASFLNNPDVVEDFAYRAIHTGVVLGKSVSKTFYGKKHTKSYYLGCSTGGRQGWKMVQSFADEFDGMVAGAPAISFNNLTSRSYHFFPLTGTSSADTFIPMDMWNTIHNDILKQCDALDGASEGILESPDLCDYNPEGLLCSDGQTSGCLTATQIRTLKAVYSPLKGVDGSLAYLSGQAFMSADWFRYAIFNSSSWDPTSLTPADYATSSHLNLFNIETWQGDLSAFKDRGGKVLHYHGLSDPIISSENSPRYYEHVSKTMGLSPAELDDFYRLFRVSGMGHCNGGPGATFIGNRASAVSTLDPSDNKGIAPETITGTAYVNQTKSLGVDYKRRHCRWPYHNVYKGTGSVKNPDHWECVKK